MASPRKNGADSTKAQPRRTTSGMNVKRKRHGQYELGVLIDDNLISTKRTRLDQDSNFVFDPAFGPSAPQPPMHGRLDLASLPHFPSPQTDPLLPCHDQLGRSRALRQDDAEVRRQLMEQNAIHQRLTAVQIPNAFATPNMVVQSPLTMALSLIGSSFNSDLSWRTHLLDPNFANGSMSSAFQHSHVASLPVKNCLALLAAQLLSHQPSYVESLQTTHRFPPVYDAATIPTHQFTDSPQLHSTRHQNVKGNSVVTHLQVKDTAAFEEGAQTSTLQNNPLTSSSLHSTPHSSAASRRDSNPKQRSSRSRGGSNKKQTNQEDGARHHLLSCSDDRGMLNEHLCFLRQQIVYFQATMDDILSHTRGRNKNIALGQVGIRCKHCSHVPAGGRGKGSTYFPSNLMGIYQAAQNIHVEHLQSGLCPKMPPEVKKRFVKRNDGGSSKSKLVASCTGKAYWADSAMKLGMIDTEDGIRFATD